MGFTLRAGEREALRFLPGQSLRDRLALLWPRLVVEALRPFDAERHGIRARGLAALPSVSQQRGDRILLYVNGRSVSDKRLLAAVREAYKGRITSRDYPQVVLFVDMPPDMVDVNVHPAKSEVRFRDESSVFSAVLHAVQGALVSDVESVLDAAREADAAPLMRHAEDETREDEGQWQVRRPDADDGTAPEAMTGTGSVADAPSVPSSSGSAAAFASGRTAPAGLREAVAPSAFSAASFAEDAEGTGRLSADRQEFFESARQTARIAMPPDHVATETGHEGADETVAERVPAPETDGPEALPGTGDAVCGPGTAVTDESAAGRHELVVGGLTYLGQVAETYLVLRDASDALMLLDQHAAHERVLYERLRKGAFAGTAQCLALPLELALQPVEEERFLEVRDNLERMGFDVSCSGGRLLARGIPPSLSRSEAGEFLREVLAGRKDDIRAMFISLSCKGAIKAGGVPIRCGKATLLCRRASAAGRICP